MLRMLFGQALFGPYWRLGGFKGGAVLGSMNLEGSTFRCWAQVSLAWQMFVRGSKDVRQSYALGL